MVGGSSLQNLVGDNGDWENGEYVIDLTSEIEEDKSLWVDLAIIGRIIGPKMTRTTIKEWTAKSWGMNLVAKFIPRSFFVVVFANNSERNNILCKQNWFVGDHPVYIQPWAPNFNPLPLVVYNQPV
ncbi:hypothetical protein SUGI_0782650 [Cryptomeria japonica]|nr:hypothetical protein SUGI_0782650 [Cryptomeria japonica]